MSRVLRISASAFLPIILCVAAHPVRSATITVNTISDVVAIDGHCSLREAITAVNRQAASGNMTGECAAGDGNDDTIVVPAGTYTLSIAGADEDNNTSGDLDIRASVAIEGAGMGITIVDAAQIDRVIDIPVAGITLRLSDVSIVNGQPPDGFTAGENGGGIDNPKGANLVLTRVELANNTTGDGASSFAFGLAGGAGGALYSKGGSVSLSACNVHDNRTGVGGNASNPTGTPGTGGNGAGIAVSTGSIGVEFSSFTQNQTGNGGSGGTGGDPGSGGGIFADTDSVSIATSVFDSNQTGSTLNAKSDGGALFLTSSTAHIAATSITHNTSGDGGGIASMSSTLTVTNTTIAGNSAGQFGAGLFLTGGSAQLEFTTVSANQSAIDSGAMRIESGVTVTIRNSIVAGNTAVTMPDCFDIDASTMTSLGYNIAGDGCPAGALGDVATTAPRLGPLADNGGIGLTLMPIPASPATDAGNCAADGVTVDQRGHARLVDIPRVPNAADACDIGAVELDDDIFWNGFD